MDTDASWVAGFEEVLGELLGQVYGKEYLGKYDAILQKFSETLRGWGSCCWKW